MALKPILILGNMNKPGVAEQIEALRPWFAQRAKVVAVLPAVAPLPPRAAKAKVCVVFGGDGTLLSAGRALAGMKMPMMGVNMGKLGFLAEYSIEHFQQHFDAILADEVEPVERIMLDVKITDCGRHSFGAVAANDVAIAAGPPFRMIDLDVGQDHRHIARYFGDGLVVATPTGSTGYNMSVGGPILEPSMDAMVISPIANHSLSIRPIIIPGNKTVVITATRVNAGSAVIIDGQISSGLCDGAVIEIGKAATGMFLIPHPGRTFFQTLADKLHWGQSPHDKGR